MKKLAIGCGIVVLVCAVVTTVALYVVAYKARSYLRETGALSALETMGKGVNNTAPFTPPADGELTADMVRRFAAVEDALVKKLGPRMHELAAIEEKTMQQQHAERRKSTPSEDFATITRDMGFVLQAQGAWVDALNVQRFSMDEYQWIRGQVWAASGMNVVELVEKKQAAVAATGATKPIADAIGPVPPRNRQLVAPYQARLKDWAALAFFGL